MSSKKTNKNNSLKINIQNVKFLNNASILDYVSGDSIMQNSLSQIKKILEKEHCKEKTNFTDEMALNLDFVEIKRQKGTSERGNTVDFVVGLENKHLLLVEAKFQVKNVANIVSDILDKIDHSKRILTNNPNFISFYKQEIILLNNKDFQQNYNKLRRMLISKSITIEPQTISNFYNVFFGK